MKAHQRLIREKISKEESYDLFGRYWETIDININKAIVKPVTNEQAEHIILKYEWLGSMGTSTRYCYGIYFDNHLAGVACYGELGAIAFQGYKNTVGKNYYNKGIILNRGACVHWAHEHAGSKLIAKSLKEIKNKNYKFAVAYADSKAGEIGTLYQATNWHYIGVTKDVHYDIYFKNGDMYLGDRNFYMKFGTRSLKKMEEFVSTRKNLEIKKREGKGRYIKLLGTKKENKEMMLILKNKIKPYPKRTT
tara:strand:- start:2579 stop:3325 length:747 start_codon:yes stop_codon:yes gene_type:complete